MEQISLLILPLLILTIMLVGIIKKQPIYEQFVEGAKNGFTVSIRIIPYLVAIIFAISVFRASGLLEALTSIIGRFTDNFGLPSEVIPIIYTRPLSGSAALGLFSELVSNINPDSYTAKLAAIIIGSSETTFYVLSVYFGAIGILKYRYALLTGILADIIGILTAVFVAQIFF